MRIACLLDNGFEDSEFRVPCDRFRQEGHEVTVIGLKAGSEVAGYRGRERARVDTDLATARPADFDALFLPGGYSPDHLRIHDEAVRFTRAFFTDARPVFAVCHGPQLLITAEVVAGRRMTAWPTIQGDLRKVGADVVDEEVVVDGNLVTSRKPDDLDAFCRESLRKLSGVAAETRG